jgi:hypothetical protein
MKNTRVGLRTVHLMDTGVNGGVLHPGDALLHSLGVRGPDQVFEGHSESRLHVYIVFVHSPVNTTTLSACT